MNSANDRGSRVLRLRRPILAFGIALAAATAPAEAQQLRTHFDSDAPMRAPGFFDFAVLGAPGAARWLVMIERNSPSTPNCLTQVEASRPAGSVTAALRRNVTLEDGSVSAFVKAGGSRSGFVLRMVNEKDLLLLLADPKSGELVLSRYHAGQPEELGRGRAGWDDAWEKVAVALDGAEVSVSVHDRRIFEAKDPSPAAGSVGLAAAGPGQASFDELVIDSRPSPTPAK